MCCLLTCLRMFLRGSCSWAGEGERGLLARVQETLWTIIKQVQDTLWTIIKQVQDTLLDHHQTGGSSNKHKTE